MKRHGTIHYTRHLLALLAAFFLAVGPALAPVASAAKYIEICTAFGILKMAVTGDQAQDQDDPAGHKASGKNNHCLFCNMRQWAVLPPSLSLFIPDYTIVRMSADHGGGLIDHRPALAYHAQAPPVSS